jgi:hypothetical protein
MVLRSFAVAGHDYDSPGNWRASGISGGNPNASDSSPLAGSPTADEDRDGAGKLLEHALGTSDADPTDLGGSISFGIQSLKVDGVIDDYMTITHLRNLSADDTTLLPEGSYDLRTWFGGEANFPIVSETNRGDGTSLVTRRTLLPVVGWAGRNIYLRLRARAVVAISLVDWMAGQGAADPEAPFGSSSISNLLAYAFGADLASIPEAALPRVSIVNAGGVDYPALTYRIRKGAEALVCEMEVSEDLVSWQGGGAVASQVGFPQDNGDGTDTVTVRSLQPVAPGSVQYLRLRVRLPL